MVNTEAKGLSIALFGALAIVPDTAFMRLSGLSGAQMMAWRGLLLATTMVMVWAITARHRRGDLAALATPPAWAAILAQAVNACGFAWGIANAPVAVVLFAVATVPIWAAILGALTLGDRLSRAALVACALVIAGVGLSVSGEYEGDGALPGALAGFAVAMSLASSFTLYRAAPGLPIPLTLGGGAAIAGGVGWIAADTLTVTDGALWAIWVTGAAILPTSFYALSLASRYTQAANVSLIMLLETVLGPVIVWLWLGEAVGPRGLTGGAVVVGTLAVYLTHRSLSSRRTPDSA